MRNIIDSKVLQVVFGLIRFASITISQTIDDIIVQTKHNAIGYRKIFTHYWNARREPEGADKRIGDKIPRENLNPYA